MRSWKLAISLAVVAAFAGPLVMGSWRLKPGSWHPLRADERQSIAEMAADSANCTHFTREETEVGKAICRILLGDLHSGGRWESGEKITWRYAEKNIEVMVRFRAHVRGNDAIYSSGTEILGLAEKVDPTQTYVLRDWVTAVQHTARRLAAIGLKAEDK